VKPCPRCELLNPDDGLVCSCGFDFAKGNAAAAGEERRRAKRRGRLYQLIGAVLVVFGAAGGMRLFGISSVLSFTLGDLRMDLGAIIVGVGFVAQGLRDAKRLAHPRQVE
jgi:hypothetical protein